ncbi:MAG: hypothetical protein MGG37_16130 [Trichodesmium sp. MAG_R01]|nr:hypothetical protein [Trichodesmium sp. MAG_R01]
MVKILYCRQDVHNWYTLPEIEAIEAAVYVDCLDRYFGRANVFKKMFFSDSLKAKDITSYLLDQNETSL